MNTPIRPPVADAEVGRLDCSGQQVWRDEDVAALALVERDPEFQQRLAQARADIVAGRARSHEAHLAELADRKRRWSAERAG